MGNEQGKNSKKMSSQIPISNKTTEEQPHHVSTSTSCVFGEVHYHPSRSSSTCGERSKNRSASLTRRFRKVQSDNDECSPLSPLSPPSIASLSPQLSKLSYDTITQFKLWFTSSKISGSSIIYDSMKEELSSRAFNSKIVGKGDIIIYVTTTTGEYFGSYHYSSVLPRSFQAELDDNHFVFTLANGGSRSQKFYRRTSGKALTLQRENDKDLVVTVNGAYWIKSDRKIYTNQNFSSVYDAPPAATPLTRRSVPYYSLLYRLLVIQI